MTRQQRRTNWMAFSIGLAATAVVMVAYVAGWMDWVEYKMLDWRFRYTNSIPQHPDIVCLDIDDSAIEAAGRFPWSRSVQTMLISIPAELGARAIAVDLEWLDPETLRADEPPDLDILGDPLAVSIAPENLRRPDLELRAAIADAGNVYLAIHMEAGANPSDENPTDLVAYVRERLAASPELSDLPVFELVRRLHAGLSDAPFENDTPQRQALIRALRYVLDYNATMRTAIARADRVAPVTWVVASIGPANHVLAEAARRCGFVSFEPDSEVTRRLPLLAEHEGHVIPQLAFGVACDMLGVSPDDIRAAPNLLILDRPGESGGPIRVQLDDRGRMLVPWLPERRWLEQFVHVPAGPLWQVYDRRERIARNRDDLRRGVWLVLSRSELPERESFRKDLDDWEGLTGQYRALRYAGKWADAAAIHDFIPELASALDQKCAAIIQQLKREPGALAGELFPTDDGRAPLEAVLPLLEARLAANQRLEREITETMDRLRPLFAGKICLVGYTATAAGDTTAIPTSARVPGVIAHASVLNGFLTGRLTRWASGPTDLGIAAVLGIAITLCSIFFRPRSGFAVMLLVVLAFLAFAGAAVFYKWTYWVALTPAVAAMLLSYFAIALFRYIFVERERRQLATALGQYTSKEIARQVAEEPELCRRAETREVTSIFTDMKGFTSISEQIGAERTQRVLNVCLGRFTEIMLEHEAMVNKFIGDGIFAFWNPVILPQQDHARRGCETAVDLIVGMRTLIEEQRSQGGDEIFDKLVMRVGVASGNAVVGPCGSEQKYDYTCIGDSVNLAARLESANKFFGTLALVSGATRDAGGEGFVYRWLGSVQVKGKREGVSVYELLGREGQVNGPQLDYAQRFESAVSAFQQRRFDVAKEAFYECTRQQPLDLAAREYATLASAWANEPPPESWNGAIELREK